MTVGNNDTYAIATHSDWLNRLAPIFQPLRGKTKTIAPYTRDFSRVLSKLQSIARISIGSSHCLLQLWLVGVITSVSCFRQSFENQSYVLYRFLRVRDMTVVILVPKLVLQATNVVLFFSFHISDCLSSRITWSCPFFPYFYATFQARSSGRGRGRAPPSEIFRFELNSATIVEFCLLTWTAVNGSYSFKVLSIIVRLYTVVLLYNLELRKGTKSYFCSAKNEKL